MRIALLVYVVIYALFMGALFAAHIFVLPPEEERQQRPWEFPLDLVLSIVTCIGMILLFLGNESPLLKSAWKVVSILLVVLQLYTNARGRARHMQRHPDEHRSLAVVVADLGVLLFVSPALALNLAYAFFE